MEVFRTGAVFVSVWLVSDAVFGIRPSMCVVVLLINVQQTLRSVAALQIAESNVNQP